MWASEFHRRSEEPESRDAFRRRAQGVARSASVAAVALTALVVSACGGGGGSSGGPVSPIGPSTSTPTSTPTPTATPTVAPQSYQVGGTVSQIPVDAYGPTTIGPQTYAAADANSTTLLVGATVIVGPVPIIGATPPATLPAGDVSATTSSAGTFMASLTVAPAAPSSSEPFVVPSQNLSAFTPPATGYYVQVFGVGTDGLTAGKLLPLHRFVASSTSLALRITTASSAEAGALAAINSDRASNGAGPLTFDESAEEVARLHASDESALGNTCHYDSHNIGPASRYLALGGIGLTGEGLALVSGPAAQAFGYTEAAFLAEKNQAPPGGHFTNLVDGAHVWAGLAAATFVSSPSFMNVDYEIVTPNNQDQIVGASGYTNSGCPTGVVVNNS